MGLRAQALGGWFVTSDASVLVRDGACGLESSKITFLERAPHRHFHFLSVAWHLPHSREGAGLPQRSFFLHFPQARSTTRMRDITMEARTEQCANMALSMGGWLAE